MGDCAAEPGEDCFGRTYFGICNGTCRSFFCEGCKRWQPVRDGADDDAPELCSSCWFMGKCNDD